jgi:acyl carrier protein phosphodiesterase
VLLWTLTVLAVLTAITALLLVRRQAKRLDALNQSYWELRYDYTRLRSQLARLDPEVPSEPAPAPAAAAPSMTFVPLSSIRKKDA